MIAQNLSRSRKFLKYSIDVDGNVYVSATGKQVLIFNEEQIKQTRRLNRECLDRYIDNQINGK